jgi:uncharacterized protein (DUF1330 family)
MIAIGAEQEGGGKLAAYLIVDIDVRDSDRYQTYLRETPKLIQKHGGEYLVRGGALEVLEGAWEPHRLVLFRFHSMQAIRALFDDPEYRPLTAIRHECASTNIIAVEGIEGTR